ncbi:hypothetical protein BGZ94_007564 [Podila epigama]|nr:hypothetical protein BGZ94_007564 [Podila epigama]
MGSDQGGSPDNSTLSGVQLSSSAFWNSSHFGRGRDMDDISSNKNQHANMRIFRGQSPSQSQSQSQNQGRSSNINNSFTQRGGFNQNYDSLNNGNNHRQDYHTHSDQPHPHSNAGHRENSFAFGKTFAPNDAPRGPFRSSSESLTNTNPSETLKAYHQQNISPYNGSSSGVKGFNSDTNRGEYMGIGSRTAFFDGVQEKLHPDQRKLDRGFADKTIGTKTTVTVTKTFCEMATQTTEDDMSPESTFNGVYVATTHTSRPRAAAAGNTTRRPAMGEQHSDQPSSRTIRAPEHTPQVPSPRSGNSNSVDTSHSLNRANESSAQKLQQSRTSAINSNSNSNSSAAISSSSSGFSSKWDEPVGQKDSMASRNHTQSSNDRSANMSTKSQDVDPWSSPITVAGSVATSSSISVESPAANAAKPGSASSSSSSATAPPVSDGWNNLSSDKSAGEMVDWSTGLVAGFPEEAKPKAMTITQPWNKAPVKARAPVQPLPSTWGPLAKKVERVDLSSEKGLASNNSTHDWVTSSKDSALKGPTDVTAAPENDPWNEPVSVNKTSNSWGSPVGSRQEEVVSNGWGAPPQLAHNVTGMNDSVWGSGSVKTQDWGSSYGATTTTTAESRLPKTSWDSPVGSSNTSSAATTSRQTHMTSEERFNQSRNRMNTDGFSSGEMRGYSNGSSYNNEIRSPPMNNNNNSQWGSSGSTGDYHQQQLHHEPRGRTPSTVSMIANDTNPLSPRLNSSRERSIGPSTYTTGAMRASAPAHRRLANNNTPEREMAAAAWREASNGISTKSSEVNSTLENTNTPLSKSSGERGWASTNQTDKTDAVTAAAPVAGGGNNSSKKGLVTSSDFLNFMKAVSTFVPPAPKRPVVASEDEAYGDNGRDNDRNDDINGAEREPVAHEEDGEGEGDDQEEGSEMRQEGEEVEEGEEEEEEEDYVSLADNDEEREVVEQEEQITTSQDIEAVDQAPPSATSVREGNIDKDSDHNDEAAQKKTDLAALHKPMEEMIIASTNDDNDVKIAASVSLPTSPSP